MYYDLYSLVKQFSVLSLIPTAQFKSKYSPHKFLFEHPQATVFSRGERPSFTFT